MRSGCRVSTSGKRRRRAGEETEKANEPKEILQEGCGNKVEYARRVMTMSLECVELARKANVLQSIRIYDIHGIFFIVGTAT